VGIGLLCSPLVKSRLNLELKRLSRLAFYQADRQRDLIVRFHRVRTKISKHQDFYCWEMLYPWLFAPLTLWPIDIEGAARHVLAHLESGKRVGPKLELLLAMLGNPPAEAVQDVVIAQDHLVQQGSYEKLIKQTCKYDTNEKELCDDPEFKREWNQIKRSFEVDEFRNNKGIIRRRPVQERNFRSRDWAFRWTLERKRFQILFDAFCHRWHLYGMQGDKPLLLKLSVNLTPHGTMILIPSYWSFDRKRDLNWEGIMHLHRARAGERQGPKLSPNKLAKHREAELARKLQAEAASKGLRGEAKRRWIMHGLQWHPATDESKLKRLLKFGLKSAARL